MNDSDPMTTNPAPPTTTSEEPVVPAITLADRFVAGVAGLLALPLTVLFVIGALSTMGPVPRVSTAFGGLIVTFPVWGAVLGLIGGVVGFALGASRTAELLGHLWSTAQPRRAGITIALWLTLAAIALGIVAWIFLGPAFRA